MPRNNNPKFRVKFFKDETIKEAPIEEGNFIASTGNGDLFIDTSNDERVLVGNLQFVDKITDLLNIKKPLNKIYFCKENNCGYVHKNGSWETIINYYPQWQTF